MTIIFGQTPPPPKTHATCKAPRWQWDRDGQRWVCMVCYMGNPMVLEQGAGPTGAECKDCKHMFAHKQSGVYWKCDLRKNTHGAGTDHRRHWPACARFEPLEQEATQ